MASFFVMPSLFRMLSRCFSIVRRDIFSSLEISLLASPLFIILQISISLGLSLYFFPVNFKPNGEVNSSIFFFNKSRYFCESPYILSFCITGSNKFSTLAIILSCTCFFSISSRPRISPRAIFFCTISCVLFLRVSSNDFV